MPWHGLMWETKQERQRRLARERAARRRKKKQQPDTIAELVALPRRALRRRMRSMSRKMRRKVRSRKRKLAKSVFGPCPTCGKPNSPRHTCRLRFTAGSARNVQSRLARQAMPGMSGRNARTRRAQANEMIAEQGRAMWRTNTPNPNRWGGGS
jgi:RNA polymerase-binding transcription factor DksA